MKFVETIGFKVFDDHLSTISIRNGACRVINTISPDSYGVSTKDSEFERALKASDYLVLDGVYFSLASIFLQGKNIRRNQGPDVFYYYMERLNEEKGKAFFLGSTDHVLQRMKENAGRDYPNITVDYYSPPFKQTFSAEDDAAMIERINAFDPDVLFVGLSRPKQEKWAIKNRDKLKAGLAVCIGNVFDWYAGTQKAIHPMWFKLRLGWLVRIILRPEIFKRNFGNQMKFLWHLLLYLLRLKTYS